MTPADLDAVDEATARLLATVERLSDDDLRAPSRLPGWTRGHVLTHIARHADAMDNLLTWARTGHVTPAYGSQQERDAAIDAGAGRDRDEFRADVAASANRLRESALGLSQDAWERDVRIFDRPPFPASEVLVRRLVEVELHHVDLDAGYTPPDWPRAFATRPLPEPLDAWRAERAAWFG